MRVWEIEVNRKLQIHMVAHVVKSTHNLTCPCASAIASTKKRTVVDFFNMAKYTKNQRLQKSLTLNWKNADKVQSNIFSTKSSPMPFV